MEFQSKLAATIQPRRRRDLPQQSASAVKTGTFDFIAPFGKVDFLDTPCQGRGTRCAHGGTFIATCSASYHVPKPPAHTWRRYCAPPAGWRCWHAVTFELP